jgi:polar amino acid transport system substrate-binding protein
VAISKDFGSRFSAVVDKNPLSVCLCRLGGVSLFAAPSNIDELLEIENTCLALSAQHSTLPLLMVGFNRRFSPLASFLKSKLGKGPMAMLYRINAGAIQADSWIQDVEIGGGRIVGEVCHFVDFMTFMCGALPVRVYSSAMTDPLHLNDVVNINLEFEDGSIGTISYLSNGSKSVPKEYVEIYRAGVTGILRDFKEAEIHGKGKPERKKLLSQDKGQKLMVGEFIRSVRDGANAPIGLEEIVTVTRTSFKAVESLRLRQAVEV